MKIKKTKLGRIVFIIIAFIMINVIASVSNNGFAQNISNDGQDLFPFEKNPPQYNNNIGFTASFFSGIGFHYKRNITPEHAVKVVFFGWRSAEEENNNSSSTQLTDIWVSFGLEYRYYFFKVKKDIDLYVLAGAGIDYSEKNESNPDINLFSLEINNVNSIGLGIGSDFRLGKHFVFNVEIGFVNRWERKPNRKISAFGFAAGTGIGFIF